MGKLKTFLLKMSDEYEEISKTGTVELEEEEKEKGVKCDFCKRKNHTASECRMKKSGEKETERKRRCWKCGSDSHLSNKFTRKVDQSNNSQDVVCGDQPAKADENQDSGLSRPGNIQQLPEV